ncbi:MAG: SDR family NAD(P)-dependent oxidoreductase [Candidatus Saccharibacteria bacterium]
MVKSNKKVVLITGISSGIGLAAAQLFSSRDWIVVGTVRGKNTKALEGMSIDIQEAEMNKPEDLRRIMSQLIASYGRLDALVCNAGYALIGPIDTLDYDQIRDQYLTNTVAPAELTRLAIPMMKAQAGGSIVYVSSIVGRTGLAGFGMYSSSKWALEGLAESLAAELYETNIRIKLIEPSGVNTAFWTSLKRGKGRDWKNDELGRIGGEVDRTSHGLTSDKVAEAIYIAATDGSTKLRYPLGQTRLVGVGRRLLPDRLFRSIVRRATR